MSVATYAADDVPAEAANSPRCITPTPVAARYCAECAAIAAANSIDTSSPPIGIGTTIAGAAPARFAPVTAAPAASVAP